MVSLTHILSLILQEIISAKQRPGAVSRPLSKGLQMELRFGKYRHFKGNEYLLLHIARHSETLEEMVVYKALYGDGEIWVRPASMWNESVHTDTYNGPRFRYIGE